MANKQLPKTKLDDDFRDLAVRMALHCVRNTVIEDYHAEGKLSQDEMKAFNKEVANKLYLFLQLFLNPAYEEYRRVPELDRLFYKPAGWDPPEADEDFLGALEFWRDRKAD